MRLEVVEQEIDKIKAALGSKPYMINMLSNRNADMELELAKMLVRKGVPAVEASAYVVPSEALVYYRVKGLTRNADGTLSIPHRIIAKVSREEVLEKFVCPPAADAVQSLLKKGLITAEEAALAAKIPMADDITTGRPMVSMLPALIALANRKQAAFGYQSKVRVGAGGGIGTGLSCLGAFEMGAAYVVTGSVNQACVESGTSDYVKQVLAETAMADVTMAPCADMFESGAKVDPGKIPLAEKNPKMKMALVFRWYLGSSSRWAVVGAEDRKFDMQIWCGQSMGAFNLWVKGTPLEKAENRHVDEIALLLLRSCAYHYTKNLALRLGVSPDCFYQDIL